MGGSKTARDISSAIRRATVILALFDSSGGALIVTEIKTLGISAVVNEYGDTTSSANKIMWDIKRFMRAPKAEKQTQRNKNHMK